ncbi:MAG: hypothetical protein V4450_14440 [Bacteroidota bacterium]
MQLYSAKYLRIPLGFLFILFALGSMAQEKERYVWPVKLQKDYNKSYPVSNETLALLNRYGQMKLETWDKNEIQVEAHITVGAQTNEYATQVLDRISIADEKTTDRIEFKTKLGSWSDNGSNGGHEMRIDYTVHLPANAKLYAENNFGSITIGDFKGEAELLCKYGTLTAGKLSNSKSVTVEFGSAVIESVRDTKLLFKYSKVEIGKLAGNIDAEFQFCNSIDMPIDNALKQLQLKNNYTSLYLLAPKDFSADYDITTNNARASGKNELVIKEEKAVDSRPTIYNANHRYTGSIGKGGDTKITIKSNFGNIRVIPG